eukprot:1502069-Alexandrium_andersonii.AAC.1
MPLSREALRCLHSPLGPPRGGQRATQQQQDADNDSPAQPPARPSHPLKTNQRAAGVHGNG